MLKSLVLKIFFVLIGSAALLYSVARVSSGSTETSYRSIAAGIAAGETYGADVLEALAPMSSDFDCGDLCDPNSIRGFAFIRVRQTELIWQDGTPAEGKTAGSRAEAVVRRALAISPSDAFLWFALAWVAKNNAGYTPLTPVLLRLSYEAGAGEGWIAAHRNGFVVALLAALPQDLKNRAFAEFRGMVESNYTNDAASILTGPGWAVHDELLQAVSSSPEQDRARLSRRLLELGFSLHVPGIERSPARPWH